MKLFLGLELSSKEVWTVCLCSQNGSRFYLQFIISVQHRMVQQFPWIREEGWMFCMSSFIPFLRWQPLAPVTNNLPLLLMMFANPCQLSGCWGLGLGGVCHHCIHSPHCCGTQLSMSKEFQEELYMYLFIDVFEFNFKSYEIFYVLKFNFIFIFFFF